MKENKIIKSIFITIRVLISICYCKTIPVIAENKELLIDGCVNEDEMILKLREYDGWSIIDEYIFLENEGASNLIPYACALKEKYTEFSTEQIINLLLREDTLIELESVLVEMLHLHNYNFGSLLYLQEENNIELNTKQILLLSDTIDNRELIYYITKVNDFRARSAMQQLSFNDKELALMIAVNLLNQDKLSFYQICAVNIAIDEYYRYYYSDDRYKDFIVDKLINLYNYTENKQEKYWIADSLGWIHSYKAFKYMIDNEKWDLFDRYVYYQLCDKSKEFFYDEHHTEKDYDYYQNKLIKLMNDEVIENTFSEYWQIGDTNKSTSSLSSYKGYAVYRDGVINSTSLNLFDHAAIMNLSKINGGSGYAYYPNSTDVIQASGPNTSVSKKSWLAFLDGNTFKAACKPNGCSMTTTNILYFHTKALALIGIPYVFTMQINYPVYNNGSVVEPSQISQIRCDGVVEYVYEYYGYQVGGLSSNWNISLNYTSNYQAHQMSNVTPRKQWMNLLTIVTTSQSDLY